MNSAPSPHLLAHASFGAPASGPLHGQVRQFLRATIEEHFVDGQCFWTERLLIERLGIARGTLRQALDELTREGLLVREVKRGSFVRKTVVTALGLVFRPSDSDFCAEMMQQIGEQCVNRGLHLELYPLLTDASNAELPAKVRNQPANERLLLMPEGVRNAAKLAETLGQNGYRMLSLDEMAEPGEVPFVTTDGKLAVRIALEHLVSLGHRRITFLVNEPGDRLSVQRKISEFEIYASEMRLTEARVWDCGTRNGDNSFDQAYTAMPKLWKDESAHPTAIFTASDPGAWAALRWFAEQGIKVPDQVSVLGYEGVKPDAFTQPPLSTVAHDVPQLAVRAIDLLWCPCTELHSELVAPRLVLRQSTAPPPLQHAKT